MREGGTVRASGDGVMKFAVEAIEITPRDGVVIAAADGVVRGTKGRVL